MGGSFLYVLYGRHATYSVAQTKVLYKWCPSYIVYSVTSASEERLCDWLAILVVIWQFFKKSAPSVRAHAHKPHTCMVSKRSLHSASVDMVAELSVIHQRGSDKTPPLQAQSSLWRHRTLSRSCVCVVGQGKSVCVCVVRARRHITTSAHASTAGE